MHSEAQTGCPVTYTYTRGQARELVEASGFRVRRLWVDHIFPYRIADYIEYRYVKEPLLPVDARVALPRARAPRRVASHGRRGVSGMTRIAVVGLGKLGAPLAAVLASKGHDVIGIDFSESTVQLVNDGYAPVDEPGLQELISASIGADFEQPPISARQLKRASRFCSFPRHPPPPGGSRTSTCWRRPTRSGGRSPELLRPTSSSWEAP